MKPVSQQTGEQSPRFRVKRKTRTPETRPSRRARALVLVIRNTFIPSLHRQLYDPCASDLGPSGSFSRVHIMRSHFILRLPVIICVRATPPAGVHEGGRLQEDEEKRRRKSRPFFNASTSSRKLKSSGSFFFSFFFSSAFLRLARASALIRERTSLTRV